MKFDVKQGSIAPFLILCAVACLIQGKCQESSFKIVRKKVVCDEIPSKGPTVVRAPNGDLLVTFESYYDQLFTARSHDNGITWERPQQIVEGAGESSLGLTKLRNGSILWPFCQVITKLPCCAERRANAYVYRSTDNGMNWQGDAPVATDIREVVPYGHIIELPDGRLLMPVWGAHRQGERWQSGTLESTDGGRAWSTYRRIGYDPEAGCRPDNGFNETSIAELPDHKLIAILRAQRVGTHDNDPEAGPCDHYAEPLSVHFYRAVSQDLGKSWSRPERLSLVGTSPSLYVMSDNTLMLGYRDHPEHETDTEHYGVGVRVSHDQGMTWVNGFHLEDPKGYHFTAKDTPGYPDFVDLPGGDILVVFRSVQLKDGKSTLYIASNVLHRVH